MNPSPRIENPRWLAGLHHKGIEKIEKKQNKLYDEMAKPEFFQQDPKEIEKKKQELEAIEDELLQVFSRWEELESLK